MDTLKKSSFTLLEMTVTMVVSGILILALSYQFVAMARFKTIIENKAEPSREAYIVLNHMMHVLRFAKASSAIEFPGVVSTEERLTATIEKGHISMIPTSDTVCYYRRIKATNVLYFKAGTDAERELSRYVAYFDAGAVGAAPNREIILKLIFSKGDTVTPIQTKIRVLGQ